MREDDLHDRLAELAGQAGLVLPDPRDVRSRGDRRRAGVNTVAAGLTALAVVASTVSLSSAQAPTAALPSGDSTGEFSPAATASAMPPVSGSAAPSGTPASSTPPSPTLAPRTYTKIPASLSMLHEGEPGWTTNNDPNVPSAFNPCQGPDVTAVERTDARTLKGPGLPGEESHSPSKVTHQLFLYTTEQAAIAVFVELITSGCGWIHSPMDLQDTQNTHLAHLRKIDPPSQEPGVYWLHDANLVRTGNALLITHADASGGGMTSNMADQELNYILKPLCDEQLICR